MVVGTKKIIRAMIEELIENNCEHKHGRVTWFDYPTRVNKLEAIEQWIDTHVLDKQSADIILSLLMYVCGIKDNPIALFSPHSLDEFDDMVEKYHLTVNPKIHFTYDDLDKVLEAGGVESLVNAKKSSVISMPHRDKPPH